ncbi:MAG: DUF2254 domain-containing protein [Nitrosopumilus sp.]|nr:DUF2254 domain-containing protein [Nitrosopumilus sp.]
MQNGPVFLFKGVLLSKLRLFKQSLLFYPIVFAICTIILFLITSWIDGILYEQIKINFPYIDSLIFTGGADASRSILSAIAGGWTTILGVTFSVTLVTLQLSSTKYTSHIVNRFEEDRLNQLTLAWFISIVLYSMLVLKTVRTGGDNDLENIAFTPIIGVNIAVFLAIISLFIFVAFLNNISSYLRPNVLVSNILKQIIHSIKNFEKRKKYDGAFFINEESYETKKLLEIRSTKKGICKSINWQKIYHGLQNFSKIEKKNGLWMEWYKSLGDWIEKDELIAKIYEYDLDVKLKVQQDRLNINGNNNKDNYINHRFNYDKSYEQKIISYIDISNDRDISKDPIYGIELLRSLAVKSVNSSDTDVVNSCITGLFSILRYISKSKEFLGTSFTFEPKPDNKTSNSDTSATSILIIIHPKEPYLSDYIFLELSIILVKAASKQQQITVAIHFVKEYVSTSRFLLENNKINDFESLTRWCADQIIITIESFQKQFQIEMLSPIIEFKKDLTTKYPYLVDFFSFHMRHVLSNGIKKS